MAGWSRVYRAAVGRITISTLIGLVTLVVLPPAGIAGSRASAASPPHVTNIKRYVPPGVAQVTYGPQVSTALAGAPSGAHLTYYVGGPIMPTVKVYAIYWQPAGYSFDPTATDATNSHCLSDSGDAAYECVNDQFMQDLNGSAYYNTLTQYYQTDASGKNPVDIQNSVTFGGAWTDTAAFPTGGCTVPSGYTACLSQSQVQAEIVRAAAHFGGTVGGFTTLYILFTPLQVDHCAYGSCADTAFCGYHDAMSDPTSGNPLIYAYAFDEGNFSDFCGTPTTSTGATPNGDRYADSEVDTLGHEIAESANDPMGNYGRFGGIAWYDDVHSAELADLCETTYGTVDPTDGHNVVLNGDKYTVESLFSNNGDGATLGDTNSCTLGYAGTLQNTTLTTGSSSTSSTFGQVVTFTATVSAASGSASPTGAVSFYDGATALGTSNLRAAGVGTATATFVTCSLSTTGSPHAITSRYAGNAPFAAATDTRGVHQSVSASSTVTGCNAALTDGTAATAVNGGSALGQAGSYGVQATGGTAGTDWTSVSRYNGDPESTTPTGGFDYFDARVSAGNTFSKAVIVDCNSSSTGTVGGFDWYNAATSTWSAVAPAQVNLAPTGYQRGCATITVDGTSTAPSLAQLNGTPFAAVTTGGPTVAPLSHASVVRRGGRVIVTWTLARTTGVIGFRVYAGSREVGGRLIPVHASPSYRFTARAAGTGPLSIHIIWRSGAVSIVPAV